MYCLSPPLESLPKGEWFCAGCVEAAHTVEFEDGEEYTIDGFRDACNAFDQQFFGNFQISQDASQHHQQQRSISCRDVEEIFWKMVEEGSQENVEVHSAAEINTLKRGSGFPRPQDPKSEDAVIENLRKSPWNLNNLPLVRVDEHESLLANLPEHVVGLSQPFLYIGSTFSSTCWHVEDNFLYSATYQHMGAPKMWYAAPAAAAEAVENSFKEAVPDLFAKQPDMILRLVTMLPPSTLRNDGVPLFRIEQNPGEFIITFPKCYHAQVDCGFNVSEKVNFAPPDWLSHGIAAVERYRLYRKSSVLCHEQLLCDSADSSAPKLSKIETAKDESISENTARWLLPELQSMLNEERQAREQLATDGVVRSLKVVEKKLPSLFASSSTGEIAEAAAIVKPARLRTAPRSAEDDPECTICRSILHLSGVMCKCNVGRKACLRHCAELCDCTSANRVLFYRKTLEDIEKLVSTVEKSTSTEHRKQINAEFKPFGGGKARINKANAWIKKVKQALEKAPLAEISDLHSLAIAGEEFLWGGSEMAETRKMAAKITIAKRWQIELTVLKARMSGKDLTMSDVMIGDLEEDDEAIPASFASANIRDSKVEAVGGPTNNDTKKRSENGKTEEDAMDVDDSKEVTAKRINSGAATATTVSSEEREQEEKLSKKDRVIPRMKLERLEELLSTKPIPMSGADYKFYNGLKTEAHNIEKKIVDVLKEQPYPSPRTCEKLLKESSKLSVEIPNHNRLSMQIQKAVKWAEKVRAALPVRAGRAGRAGRVAASEEAEDGDNPSATLPKIQDLDELENESHGLPVSPSEYQTLIKARDETHTWRARALSLLEQDASLKDAVSLLEEGLELGTYCDEIATVQTAVDFAREWIDKAHSMDAVGSRALLDDLKQLLEVSKSLSIKVEEASWLKNRIVVRQWAEDVRAMIHAKESIDIAIKAVREGDQLLDSDDYEVAPDEEKLLILLRSHVEAGKKWEVKGRAAVQSANSKKEADKKSVDEVSQLVREGSAIPLKLAGLDFLIEIVTKTKAWLERALPCLKGKQLTRRGTSQPLPTFEQAKQLLTEAQTPPGLRLYVREVAALEERVEDAEAWNEDAVDCVTRWREDGARVTFKELELSHEDFGLELPAMEIVRKRLRALDWEEKARETFPILARIEGIKAAAGTSGKSKEKAVRYEEEEDLPEDSILDELYEESRDLDELNPKLLNEVNRRWTLVDDWRQKADAMLNPELDASGVPKQTIGPEELDALISAGKQLPAIVAKVDELEANLENHQVWFTAARELLAGVPAAVANEDGTHEQDKNRRPFADFKDLLKEVEGEGDAFMCPERAQLAAVVGRCEEWNENLRMALSRRPLNMSTEDNKHEESQLNSKQVLQTILESIHAAILDVTGTGIPPETEDGQFCLCRQAGGVQMLGCDDCGDWYHLKCINISASSAKTMNNYVCAPCVAKNGRPKALSLETYKSVHRTKRPNILALKRALQESLLFPCEMAEEELIIEIVNAHDAWCLRVRECLHNHRMIESSAQAESQAAQIARATTRREAEARARKVNEAQMRGGNPHNAELTAIQHVMLMGQSVTAATTQRTIALQGAQANPNLLSEELKNTTIDQLTQLQQFGVQLALCQAQLHMAPAISHPHIVHVLILRDRHAKLMEQLAVELKKDDGEKQILAAITQAMDPNIQVAIPATVQIASVNHEVFNAETSTVAEAAPEVKEEPKLEPMDLEEASAEAAKGASLEKVEKPTEKGKKGKAAAAKVGKKGAKLQKEQQQSKQEVSEEAHADVSLKQQNDEEALAAGNVAAALEQRGEGVDATTRSAAAQAAQAAAQAAQAAMQQQFAKQQQQLQSQHHELHEQDVANNIAFFLQQHHQQLQMMGGMPHQGGQNRSELFTQHHGDGNHPVAIDPKRQIFSGMKGALAMELEPVEETLALMREICGPTWRKRATALMRGPPFPKLIELHELKENAVAAGLCPGGGVDPLADRAFALESAGQLWLEHAATVVEDKTIPIEAARVLLREGKALPVHLKDELEELGERCELYCVCRSAYDAKRSMICCDRCDGWFHYECIGMHPPGLDEQEEASIKFACPQCCENQGIPYVPFRPLKQ
jgi:hypothetical protein